METEKIVFETEIKTGNSAASVKSVKAELRALTQELAMLEPGSAAFDKAATRAGKLKDQMEDAQMAVKAFNPEAKFQAFAGVIGGVANGFAAAQGAMALFGADSKELEKVVARTQGAIALATGLNGLLGMKDQLMIMVGVIRTNVVAAFATMKAAIMSTGIIALVAVVGTLIYQWYEEKKANEEATKELERFGKVQERLRKNESENAAKALGKRQEEKTKLIQSYADELKELGKQLKEKEIKQEEYNQLVKQAGEKNRLEIKSLEDGWAKEDAAKKQAQLDKEKELRDKKYAEAKSDYEFFREFNKKREEQDRKERAASYDKKIADEQFFTDFIAEIDDQVEKDARKRARAQIEFDKQKNEARIKQLDITANALSSFSDLAGKETAAGKALAIASTTISTYLAAQQAYASAFLPVPTAASPFIGALSAAAAVASGLANVRAIMSVQVPNGGGGGGGSMPNVNAAAPIVRPSSTMVNVNNGMPIKTTNEGGKMKVYVLESDITSTQKNVDSIRQKATIK